MTWRHRLRVSVSRAEEDIQIELQARGRERAQLDYMETQFGLEFDPHAEGVSGTVIDFFWHLPFLYAAYIDGIQVHSSLHRQTKDELITIALQRRGCTVDRFRYKPPLPKWHKLEICDSIEKRLSELLSSKPPSLNRAEMHALFKNR